MFFVQLVIQQFEELCKELYKAIIDVFQIKAANKCRNIMICLWRYDYKKNIYGNLWHVTNSHYLFKVKSLFVQLQVIICSMSIDSRDIFPSIPALKLHLCIQKFWFFCCSTCSINNICECTYCFQILLYTYQFSKSYFHH